MHVTYTVYSVECSVSLSSVLCRYEGVAKLDDFRRKYSTRRNTSYCRVIHNRKFVPQTRIASYRPCIQKLKSGPATAVVLRALVCTLEPEDDGAEEAPARQGRLNRYKRRKKVTAVRRVQMFFASPSVELAHRELLPTVALRAWRGRVRDDVWRGRYRRFAAEARSASAPGPWVSSEQTRSSNV